MLCVKKDFSVTPIYDVANTCQTGIGVFNQVDDLED